jgi:carbonic anhydrase
MTCNQANAPIDINLNSAGTCDLKCEYRFNYADSSVVAQNNGDYVLIKYDNKSVPPVLYNGEAYSLGEIRIYSPSLHKYNGSPSDAELLITHSSGSQNLIVSVPLKISAIKSKTSKFFDLLTENIANLANKPGQNVMINNTLLNLNDFIPEKKYYSYTGNLPYLPCNGTNDYVVFSPIDDAYSTISSSALKKFKSVISVSSITTKSNTFFASTKVAKMGTGASEDDDIYIECNPTGELGQTLVDENSANISGLSSNKRNYYADIFNGLKGQNFLENPFIQVLLGILIMIGVYKASKTVIKKIGKQSE